MVTRGTPGHSRKRLWRASQLKHTRLAVAPAPNAATPSPCETIKASPAFTAVTKNCPHLLPVPRSPTLAAFWGKTGVSLEREEKDGRWGLALLAGYRAMGVSAQGNTCYRSYNTYCASPFRG